MRGGCNKMNYSGNFSLYNHVSQVESSLVTFHYAELHILYFNYKHKCKQTSQ